MLQTDVYNGLVPSRRQAIAHTLHGMVSEYGIFGNKNVIHTVISQVYVREGFTDYGHCDEKSGHISHN